MKKIKRKVVSDKSIIRGLKEELSKSQDKVDILYAENGDLKSKKWSLDVQIRDYADRQEKLLLKLGRKKLESAVAYGRLSVLMRLSKLYTPEEVQIVDNLPFMQD